MLIDVFRCLFFKTKSMKKQSLFITFTAISLLFVFAGKAQEKTATLSGLIKDSLTKQALPNATIYVINAATAEITNAASTNKGSFVINNIQSGKYQLEVKYVGYKTFIKKEVTVTDDQKPIVLDDIYLSLQKEILGNVTVTSSAKPFIVQSANKITLNITQSPIASASNAYDILLQAPGVMEQDNSIKFRAKSVTILIDGKPSNLSNDDLKTMLSSMPGSNIEKVEIIPNPSAKYDAQGGSVINIKLIKNKNYGTSGSFTAGTGAGRFEKYNSGITANYKNNKINVYSSYNYEYNKQYYNNNSNRILSNSSNIIQDEYGILSKNNHSYRIGADYEINKNNVAGIQLKGYSNLQGRTISNHSVLTNNISQNDTSSSVYTNGNSLIFNPSVNVYYKSTLDSLGREITINVDYFDYNKKWQDNFTTNYFDQKNIEYLQPFLLRDNSPANNTIKSIAVDYNHPSSIGNFEAGLKIALTTTDNNILWQDLSNNNWVTDSSKTNHFIYKENISAGYITYNKAFKQAWEINLGIRAEQTNTEGILFNINQINKRSYINLFPNINVQYLKNLNNIFTLSYRKSIERFGFDVVNPFIKYQSQYSYYQGNPNIEPQFNHSIDFTYIYKQSLVLGLSETHSINALGPVYLKSGTNATISSYSNFKSADLFYVYSYYRKEFVKGWTTNIIGGFGFYRYNTSSDTTTQSNNNSSWSYLLQWNNSFNLRNGLTGELNASYQGPMASGIYKLNSIFSSNMGIGKQLLKNKAAIKLSVTDLFNTQKKIIHINYQGVVMEQERKAESRFISISFSYKFGNKNLKAKKERGSKINDLESRMTY